MNVFRAFRFKLERVSVPRWIGVILGLFTWLVVIPFIHGVVPLCISWLMPHYGWHKGSPGFWNRLGLIPVIGATGLLLWILSVGVAATPDRVQLGLTPASLLTYGPYRLTRNPIYVAELGLWFGWALYFGSLGVLGGFAVLLATVQFVIMPREERGLEQAFGQVYLNYKKQVPRWLGRTKC